jgi:hypothetical protein
MIFIRWRPMNTAEATRGSGARSCPRRAGLRLRFDPRRSGKPEIILNDPRQLNAMTTIGRWLLAVVDRAHYLLTRARLSVLDWLSPLPETPTDRAIREEGERLRKAFSAIDFDHPGPRRSRSGGARCR